MYIVLAYIYTIAAAIDGFMYPGGQSWYILWSIAAAGMIACAIHKAITE